MAFKIFSIIQKNFILLFNSKLSSLSLLFGPILLILIIGAALSNTGLKDVNANYYTPQNSSFSDSFLNNLKGRSFVITVVPTLEECINGVRNSNKNLCIELKKSDVVIPREFNLTEEEIDKYGLGNMIVLHADFSKQRTVWEIISKIDIAVNDFSSNIRNDLSVKVKDNLKTTKTKITLRRKELEDVIKILDDVETGIEETKSRLSSSKISEFQSQFSSIENNMEALSRDHPEIINNYSLSSFWVLKSYVDSMSSVQSDTLSKINDFEIKSRNAKNDLIKIDKDLGDLEDSLSKLDSINIEYIMNPIPLQYESISGDFSQKVENKLEFFDYLFPSFLTFFILLVSIVFTTNFIMKERTSNAYMRNILSNTSGITFLIGNFLTILIIVLLQSFIILFIANNFLNIPLFSYTTSLVIILLISISVFISIGMFVGYLFRSHETALISSLSLTLFLLIFSPLISPQETLPELVRTIFSYLPTVLVEDTFRRVLIFDTGLDSSIMNLVVLVVTFLIFFVMTAIISKMHKNTEIK